MGDKERLIRVSGLIPQQADLAGLVIVTVEAQAIEPQNDDLREVEHLAARLDVARHGPLIPVPHGHMQVRLSVRDDAADTGDL